MTCSKGTPNARYQSLARGARLIHLVIARATSAPTADALNLLVLLQLSAWHTADTSAVEIGLLRLNAPQTAQLLVALLLPLRNQVAISVAVLEKPIVQLLGDGFLLVVEIIDVSRACEEGTSQYMKVDEPQRA